jgi:acetolactate synthase-1/2/3 large subunit
VTNIVTAVATAYADSVPMLVVAPGPPRGTAGRDLGLLHELRDQRGVLASVVDHAARPETPEAAARAVQEAYARATAGRPRPQYVEVPVDVLEEAWDGKVRELDHPGSPPRPDPTSVARAAELLGTARRPVVLVGGGCRSAAAEVSAMAEHLQCPVLTTVNGKGVLTETHPLSLGASLRMAAAVDVLGEADVLVIVGTELGDSDLWGHPVPPLGSVIRIDVDPLQLHKNVKADLAACGDAAQVLHAILSLLPPERHATWTHQDLDRIRASIARELESDGSVWRDIQTAVRAAFDGDVVVAGDSAMVSYFGTVHHWPMGPTDRFIYPTGYATLGYGLPAAIGAQVASPDVPGVVLIGDGGFMFTVQELMTAVELRLGLPVVVVNNGGYGAIRDQMLDRHIPPLGVDLRTPDLRTLANAFGARASEVSDLAQLTRAVASARDANRPTLVELHI